MAIIYDELMRLVRELYKRKILIVVVIIFMSIVVGIYKYNEIANESSEINGELSNEVIELTPEEMELNEEYMVLDSKIQSQQEYYDNSLLLQYGGYGAPIETINFSLSNDNNENMELETIQNLYQQYITSERFDEDVKEELKLDTSGKYVEELISITQQDESGRSFSVSVLGKDKEQVQLISDAVKKLVLSYKVDEKRNLGSYDIVFINEVFTSDKSYDVDDLKIAKYKEIEANESALQMIQGQLSQEQVMALQNAGIELESEDNVSVTRAGVIVTILKGLILGAIVGLILGLAIVFSLYYLSDVIKSKMEWEETFNIPIIDEIRLRSVKKGVVSKNNGQNLNAFSKLCFKLEFLMENNNVKKLAIDSSVEEQYNCLFEDILKENLNLENSGEYVIVRDEPSQFSKKIKESDAIIMFVQIGLTNKKNIERAINETDLFNKKILGVVLLN